MLRDSEEPDSWDKFARDYCMRRHNCYFAGYLLLDCLREVSANYSEAENIAFGMPFPAVSVFHPFRVRWAQDNCRPSIRFDP